MTNPPDELVRPRMRQDVAFLETLDGVYVRGADGPFVIRGAGAYRYLSALLPHLDGSNSLTDIVAGLPAAHVGAVKSLLSTLASRGVVLDGEGAAVDEAVRASFPSQIALLEHHGDDGSGFARVAAARVLVIGEDHEATATLVAALTANGVGSAGEGFVKVASAETEEAADLICLLALDGPSQQLFSLAARARQAGTAFLPLVRVGDRLVAGPWQGAASIQSALLRMSDNGLSGTAELWQAAVAGPSSAPAGSALPGVASTMLLNVVGFEIFKQLAGSMPSDLDETVVLVDPDRLTVHTEHVVAHPAVEPSSVPEIEDVPADSVETAYRRFDSVVADTVGLMRRFDDDAVPQIPVKTAVLLAPAADAAPLVTFGVETVLEARLAALEAASVRYALNLHRRCRLLREPASDAEYVVPERLETWLGVGPARPAPAAAAEIGTNAPLALDRAAVLAGPLDWNAAEFEPDLGGLAAAPTKAETISRALVAAAGSAAVAAVARGELTVLPVSDELIAQALDPQQHRRLMILVNELTAAGEQVSFQFGRGTVPVAIVAISNGLGTVRLARAASSWVAAAESALLTAVGERQLTGTPFARVDHRLGLDADLSGLRPAGPDAAAEAADLTTSIADDRILTSLADAGHRAAVVDLTPPDLTGVTAVARVLLFRSSVLAAKES
ncbi:hypothetical protein [Kribbella sp. CA-293567]|uniref:hypothetical protein n=1 Tax=Kribbella sp. CA-293567 TaxID=3002436 RepID=UPI0022DE523A|nr:hypothetical protein [Kribbella sp. CA-293567]WBQ05858.1 hypothetical protein OX958_03430 [Kribbella sp. CA-293567]